MILRPRWRGWLMLVVALCVLSGCASTSGANHPISGATATTGSVTITTNLTKYSTTDPIGATVTNTTKSDFYTQNGKSACSIIVIEQYNAKKGVWSPVDTCNGSQAIQTLAIGQSTSVPFTLAPTSTSDVNAWQPGTYRIAVYYTTQSDGVTDQQEAHSAAFNIKS